MPVTRRQFLQTLSLAGAVAAVGLGIDSRWALGALQQAAGGDGKLPVGMNLSGIADWEAGFPFLNLMWGARVWLTRNADGSGPWNTEKLEQIPLDENGYPLELPVKVDGADQPQHVFTIVPNTTPAGKYVLLHEGQGEFEAGQALKVTDAKPGRVELELSPDAGYAIVRIVTSAKDDHVRNVRIVPAEHEKTDLAENPFRPEVLEFCKPWHCLRFMDWLSTNGSINQKWADRKKLTFYTQAGVGGDPFGLWGEPMPAFERKWSSGIAVELCIKLANLTKTDAWLCVPHLADDEYITEMAKLVKAQLDPSLKVYVEFSNEIWNWQFQQAQWMIRSQIAADLVVKGGGKSPWKAPVTEFEKGIVAKGKGEGVDHPERTGALFRRCFELWEGVFTGDDRKRLLRVCAVQAGWADTAKRTLDWVMKHGGCDAFSPAGYFGPDDKVYTRWEAAGAGLTADQVIEDMRQVIDESQKDLQELSKLAKDAGVRYVVYEGGQHIQPKGQAELPYLPALKDAQKHPKMYDLYMTNLKNHATVGCDLFCAFASIGEQGARWGSWGHLEHYGQDPKEMPKFQALLDANTPKAV